MIAFHAIISAYGFWLPNDPRGSWSTYVGSRTLHGFGGNATKTTTTRSVASRPHNHSQRRSAKALLKYPAVRFNGEQARSITKGFEQIADDAGYRILALAVLPTHLHAVIAKSQREPARVVGHLKRGATDRLIADNLHPSLVHGWITHSCWAKRSWAVYLDTQTQLQRAIRYVEDNPIKDGMRHQRWAVVPRHRRAYFATSSAPTSGAAN